MKERVPELTHRVLQPGMHEKILLRAAELVAMGWTRRTAARDATGQKVRSTAPQAAAWCILGAVDRALYELLNVDVYAVLGVDVEVYDGAPCRLPLVRTLRWPLCFVLGRADVATWNDAVCPDAAAAERLLRQAAAERATLPIL